MTKPRHHEGFKYIGHDDTIGDMYEIDEHQELENKWQEFLAWVDGETLEANK